jgi:hypothetical protein
MLDEPYIKQDLVRLGLWFFCAIGENNARANVARHCGGTWMEKTRDTNTRDCHFVEQRGSRRRQLQRTAD